MCFKPLEGVNNINGIELINQIIKLILEDETDISKLVTLLYKNNLKL